MAPSAAPRPPAVTIDARRHDAVLLALDSELPDAESRTRDALFEQLHSVGVTSAETPRSGDAGAAWFSDAAHRLHTRPGRSVALVDSEAAVAGARDSGFALVVGFDPTGDTAGTLDDSGADVVVSCLDEIAVRVGDRRMSRLPNAFELLDAVTDRVLGDRRPAVFFDFDGTLSDIVADPDTAVPADGAADALRSLAAQCPVAVLSGRGLADVRQRVGLPGIWYAGSHGFESVAPDGEHHRNEAAASAVPLLEEAATELTGQLRPVAGAAVEHKGFGVAVHYRNAGRDQVGAVLAAVRGIGRRSGLRVSTGREVIELRPDVDWDKGETLRWVLGQISGDSTRRLLPVYLGDDITDEDAFDAVLDDGVGIVVRHTDDGDRATAARYALDSPAQVSEFTAALARRIAARH